MRPITSAAFTLGLGLGLASAAFAQTSPSPGVGVAAPSAATPAAPDELTLKSAAEDEAQADAMTASLAALDAAAEADEVRMTHLREAELAQQNARIRAIKPVLPFTGHSYLFPRWY